MENCVLYACNYHTDQMLHVANGKLECAQSSCRLTILCFCIL